MRKKRERSSVCEFETPVKKLLQSLFMRLWKAVHLHFLFNGCSSFRPFPSQMLAKSWQMTANVLCLAKIQFLSLLTSISWTSAGRRRREKYFLTPIRCCPSVAWKNIFKKHSSHELFKLKLTLLLLTKSQFILLLRSLRFVAVLNLSNSSNACNF